MKTIRIVLGVVGVVVLLASGAPASNMAFSLRVHVAPGQQTLRFLAVPWLRGYGTAEGLCTALGGSSVVAEVVRWDEAGSTFVAHPCGTGTNDFTLSEGEAYGFRNVAWAEIDALLVGRHDPGHELDFPSTSGGNLHWVSLPPHLALPDRGGASGVIDAEDLCLAVGDDISAVVRWDEGAGVFDTWVCGCAFVAPFTIEPGEAYGLINAEGRELTWQPPHY